MRVARSSRHVQVVGSNSTISGGLRAEVAEPDPGRLDAHVDQTWPRTGALARRETARSTHASEPFQLRACWLVCRALGTGRCAHRRPACLRSRTPLLDSRAGSAAFRDEATVSKTISKRSETAMPTTAACGLPSGDTDACTAYFSDRMNSRRASRVMFDLDWSSGIRSARHSTRRPAESCGTESRTPHTAGAASVATRRNPAADTRFPIARARATAHRIRAVDTPNPL